MFMPCGYTIRMNSNNCVLKKQNMEYISYCHWVLSMQSCQETDEVTFLCVQSGPKPT